jgi:hypothetical protein
MLAIVWRHTVPSRGSRTTTGVSVDRRPAKASSCGSAAAQRCHSRSRSEPAAARARTGRGTSGRPAAGPGWKGALTAAGRQPGPLPLTRQRTGTGRCRHAVSSATVRWRSPPSRTYGDRTCKSSRAVLPRRASCRRESSLSRARPGARPRFAPGRPLTASFSGKIGACNETWGPGQARGSAGGAGPFGLPVRCRGGQAAGCCGESLSVPGGLSSPGGIRATW